MQTININLLSTLSLLLPEESVGILVKASSTLNNNMTKVFSSQLYWKQRTENFLEFHLVNRKVDWRIMYTHIYKAINQATEEEMAAIVSAIYLCNVFEGDTAFNTVSILLEAGWPPDDGDESFIVAIKMGHFKVAELLITDQRMDKSIHKFGNEAIIAASGYGGYIVSRKHYEELINVVNLLLNNSSVDPSDQNNKAIKEASRLGHAEIVEALLKDQRVNPTAENNEAIILAVFNGNLETVTLLLRNPIVRATVYKNIDASLIMAELDGYEPEIIAYGWLASIGKLNDVLFSLATRGNLKENDILLKDTTVYPPDMAIVFTALGGYENVVKILLKNERVNPSVDNNMAIKLAAAAGHVNVVKLLLQDPRVDPSDNNKTDSFGGDNIAIVNAARYNHLDIVKLLMANNKVSIFGKYEEYENALDNPGFVSLVKEYIKNSLSGFVMTTTLTGYISDNIWDRYNGYPFTIVKTLNKYKMFHYDFLRYLIKNHLSLIDVINKLTDIVLEYKDKNINRAVYNAVKYILNRADGINSDNYFDPDVNNLNLYHAVKGFFLLCFEPQYRFDQILETLPSINKEAIIMSAELIGAYIGLNDLLNQGLTITNQIENNINQVMSWDIGLLYD
jgi:ankyrin repeat protein